MTATDAKLPQDKGDWCSTLVSGDDASGTKTYAIGPVGEKAQQQITVKRRSSAQLTPGLQVGVADGNVAQPQQLTAEQLTGDIFITGNLVLDQAAGIGNGLADLPAGSTTARYRWHRRPGTGAPPVVIVQPGDARRYPPDADIVVEDPVVQVGGEVVFHGSGCSANETLQVSFDGTPIGTVTTDASGDCLRHDLDPAGHRAGHPRGDGAGCGLRAQRECHGGRREARLHRFVERTPAPMCSARSRPSCSAWCSSSARAAAGASRAGVAATRPRDEHTAGSSPMTFGADLDERIRLLRGIWLFSECDDEELGRIAALAHPMEAATGDELTRQGEPRASSSSSSSRATRRPRSTATRSGPSVRVASSARWP